MENSKTLGFWRSFGGVVISITVALCAVVIGALVGGKSYIVVSTIVVCCALAPLFVRFEQRRPQAREVVMVAVMCALAVAARAAFVWVPHFKPMAAIVMLAGISLGPSSGFLVGALSILASNMMFGQGPWTPWQMLSFGLCGAVFGGLAKAGCIPLARLTVLQRLILGIGGGVFMVVVAGPLLDTSSLFFMLSTLTWEGAGAVYLAGFPVNCMQGAATCITLFLLANPFLSKLVRIRRKYGMDIS